jgi:hypothetical protein
LGRLDSHRGSLGVHGVYVGVVPLLLRRLLRLRIASVLLLLRQTVLLLGLPVLVVASVLLLEWLLRVALLVGRMGWWLLVRGLGWWLLVGRMGLLRLLAVEVEGLLRLRLLLGRRLLVRLLWLGRLLVLLLRLRGLLVLLLRLGWLLVWLLWLRGLLVLLRLGRLGLILLWWGLCGSLLGRLRLRLRFRSPENVKLEDIAGIGSRSGASSGSVGLKLRWPGSLHFLLGSRFRQFRRCLLEGFPRLYLDLRLPLLFLCNVPCAAPSGRRLLVFGILVFIEVGFIIRVVSEVAQRISVVVSRGRLLFPLLLVLGAVAGVAIAAASRIATATSSASRVAAVALVASVAGIGRPSHNVGHLFADGLGLEAFFLELFLVAEESHYNLGPLSNYLGK